MREGRLPALAQAGYEVTALGLQPAPGGLARTGFGTHLDQVVRHLAGHRRPPVLIGARLGALLGPEAATLARQTAHWIACHTRVMNSV